MRISSDHSDDAILLELGARLARTRLERNITQVQLADAAGVGKATIERMERGEIAKLSSLIRVLRALDLLDALDALVPEPVASPIEQLKLQGRRRQRARGQRDSPEESSSVWSWGEDSADAGRDPDGRSGSSEQRGDDA